VGARGASHGAPRAWCASAVVVDWRRLPSPTVPGPSVASAPPSPLRALPRIAAGLDACDRLPPASRRRPTPGPRRKRPGHLRRRTGDDARAGASIPFAPRYWTRSVTFRISRPRSHRRLCGLRVPSRSLQPGLWWPALRV